MLKPEHIARILITAVSAYYLGWKRGMSDKEKDIAGEDPCLIDVDGTLKPVPRPVCNVLQSFRSTTGAGPLG